MTKYIKYQMWAIARLITLDFMLILKNQNRFFVKRCKSSTVKK